MSVHLYGISEHNEGMVSSCDISIDVCTHIWYVCMYEYMHIQSTMVCMNIMKVWLVQVH